MKSIPLILAICVAVASADTEKRLHIKSTSEPIGIDGLLDPVWSQADSVADFFQLQPYYKQRPSQRTVAKVLTASDALYCLIVCYDANGVQAHTGLLDQASGDVVSIMLDTFDDKRTAYKFAVNASGVRADCRLLDDARNRDYSWDGVWFAGAKVYNWGFAVEMKIPYKSIKYSAALTEWGLDFDRWISSNTEDLYWCEYEENEGQRVSKFGRLVFDDFEPTGSGLNLEVYPVGISKATLIDAGKYDLDPNAGIDIFYNPSQKLTYQFTANPDFAQIEADPYDFNISRYESYFDERRPFFTEGNEVFTASGRQRNTGFYRPMELFYSRRIGKALADGSTIPVNVGTKVFGRLDAWEYGGFLAFTGARDYLDDSTRTTERRATFGSVRVKKQILDNSSIGLLFVGKRSGSDLHGVLDIDGAFRTSTWQLAYQVARSIENSNGSFAGSAGFTMFGSNFLSLTRLRAIDRNFDVQQVGFVPWKGTMEFVSISGPRWYFDSGYVREMLLYFGPALYYEDADAYTDHSAILGFNMQFRDNWGYEINLSYGRSKDGGVKYTSYEATLSSWFGMSPRWNGNLWGGYSRTYNFSREYLAFYSWLGMSGQWKALSSLEIGTSYNMWMEGNPTGSVEDITYNARPYVSFTPFNDLNLRVYVDNVFVRSTDRLERVLIGALLSYNFLPKSWIYFAINEARDLSEQHDASGRVLPARMHVADRAAVLKVKYLYLF